MTTFRDAAWTLSPARLRTTRAAQMVYAFIGYPLDVLCQAAKEAVSARFPGQCPEDALSYHSRDRGITRGPGETTDSFRARLGRWLDVWRGAGVGRAMLDEIAAFLTPRTCRIRIWTQAGIVYTREADGSFTIDRVATGLWNWDGHPELFARFWVVIYSTGGVPWSRDGTWGDGEHWGDGAPTATWGSTATTTEVAVIRQIIADRKPAASICPKVIISFDAAAFAPSDTAPPLPDGTWAHYSKLVGGVKVPARDSRAIYWQGVK